MAGASFLPIGVAAAMGTPPATGRLEDSTSLSASSSALSFVSWDIVLKLSIWYMIVAWKVINSFSIQISSVWRRGTRLGAGGLHVTTNLRANLLNRGEALIMIEEGKASQNRNDEFTSESIDQRRGTNN